jgi:hypothetical protein
MENKVTKPSFYGNQNIFKRLMAYLNDFFFPTSNDGKKRRYKQIKTVSLFLVATLAFYFFEEHIQRLVAIESAEIHRGMPGYPASSF